MSSFFAQMMEPGGGVMLIPFVRLVIVCLLLLCIAGAVAGVARIHMIILSVLSGGLLLSLQFFESEYKKAQGRAGRSSSTQSTTRAPVKGSSSDKTD